MIASSLLAIFTLSSVFGCRYYPLPDENLTIAITEYPEGHYPEGYRPKRNVPIWDWIRIETEYDHTFNQLSEEKKELLEDLITTARDYFETTIKVQRLSSIQLQPSCKGEGYIVSDGIRCEYDCVKRCGSALASPRASYFTECKCTKKKCETNQTDWGGKLQNADFVLFVLVSDAKCTSQTLAFAAHCAVDTHTNRPIAGFVNICPNAFNNMKSNEVSQWEATIKHELIHAFVFSTSLFPKFRGKSKNETMKVGDVVLVPGVIERFTRMDWETSGGIVSHDVFMMVTPKVKEEARAYFQCPDLEGAEIENQGGSGTAGAHWEKRLFENEAMTGVATQVYAISRLTLALFEDSGWYQVNYDKAEPMSWGHELGCNFAKQSCLTWIRTNQNNPYPFCNVIGDVRCSTNRKAKVRCNLETDVKNVPTEYDYNIPKLYRDGKGMPTRGHGLIETADYCPYYRVYGDFSTVDNGADTRCTFSDNMNYNNYSLEIFSPTAHCFHLDGGIQIRHSEGTQTWLHSTGCYETICKENHLFIKTQNSKFYPCYHGGQMIHVEKRVYGVGTVKTRIVCPSCAELCGKKFCAPEIVKRERIGDPTRISRPIFTFIMIYHFLIYLLLAHY